MREVEVITNDYGLPTILAYENGVAEGALDYLEEPKTNTVHIADIQVSDRKNHRKGLGTALVQKMVSTVGPNKTVLAELGNDETYNEFRRMGIFDHASQRPSTLIIGPVDIFTQSPILKAFGRGGINIESVEIVNRQLLPQFSRMNFANDSEKFQLKFRGRTRAQT